jgi:hypothetical protein
MKRENDESRRGEAEMCCMMRERLVMRTREIFEFSHQDNVKPKFVAGAVRELANLERDLREAGVRCVNKIVSWTLGLAPIPSSQPLASLGTAPSSSSSSSSSSASSSAGPQPFLLYGEEYLLKMFTDLDFLVDLNVRLCVM